MRFECEKPILVGVNGVAVGIGVSLASRATSASPRQARFHPGYARVGASPDGGLTWTLPEAIGYERAMRFFLENRMVPASEALAIGMVGEVTETDDAFEARFLEYGQLLASIAPIAARQTKHLVGRITRPSALEAHLGAEFRLTLQAFTTADSKEAVRAMAAPSSRSSPAADPPDVCLRRLLGGNEALGDGECRGSGSRLPTGCRDLRLRPALLTCPVRLRSRLDRRPHRRRWRRRCRWGRDGCRHRPPSRRRCRAHRCGCRPGRQGSPTRWRPRRAQTVTNPHVEESHVRFLTGGSRRPKPSRAARWTRRSDGRG